MRTMQIATVAGCLLLAAGCSSADKTPARSTLTLPSFPSATPHHGGTGGVGNGTIPAPRSVDTLFIACEGGGNLKVFNQNTELTTVLCGATKSNDYSGYLIQKVDATTTGGLRVEAGKSTSWKIEAE